MLLKTSMLTLALTLSVASVAAFAQDAAKPAKTLTPQQQRMVDCNAQAKSKSLAGADRKTFMTSCLKGETAAAPAPAKAETQQEKMKTCNAEAKTKSLKGADRKTFMSTCLKGDTAAAPAH